MPYAELVADQPAEKLPHLPNKLRYALALSLFTILLLLYGEWLLLRPFWVSGLSRLPGDIGDTRFINIVLEHSYAFISGKLGHAVYPGLVTADFWNPKWLFFPTDNGLAKSDLLVSIAPLYGLWRVGGLSPQVALGFTVAVSAALHFLFVYLLLCRLCPSRHCLGHMGHGLGAFLSAFALPRYGYIAHPQLTFDFFIPLGLYFLTYVASFKTPKLKQASVLAAGLCLGLQCNAAIYPAWFAVLLSSLFIVCFLITYPKSLRLELPSFKRRFVNWQSTGLATLFALGTGLIATPALWHFHLMKIEQGARGWEEIRGYLLKPRALLYAPDSNSTYGFLQALVPQDTVASEKLWFLGFGVSSLLLIAAWRAFFKKNLNSFAYPFVKPLLLLVLTAWLLEWRDTRLWEIVYQYFPGANGIRGAARLILTLCLPIAVIISALFNQTAEANSKPAKRVLILLAMIILGESYGSYSYSFSIAEHRQMVDAIVSKVNQPGRPQCESFYLRDATLPAFAVQLNAMWASMETGVPTLNGYSGSEPKLFRELHLSDPASTSMQILERYREAVGLTEVPCLIQN